ncbi:MAG: hypothetical protein ACI8SJ_000104 [Shewanella sp.]|jgi:hypothetical protein
MLTLNSTAIKLKSLRFTASQELASEDASGQSSSTDSAETGAKAKMLSVTGYILFKDATHLSDLFNMAEALDAGARMIYRISNRTANTLGIKQVRFSSKIDAVEQDTQRQWRVNFTLAEYRSVPEKKEQRLPEATANQQGGEVDAEQTGIQYASLDSFLTQADVLRS